MVETRSAMAEGSNGIQIKQLADLGSGLIIAEIQVLDIREQDVNARIMKPEMFRQLVDNIKKRGQLESLPLCALYGEKIEVISGHHRLRAAKEAGLKTIVVILDVSGLNRSQIAAKQLAHNAIAGFDDNDTLKTIAKLIDDVDDMLESYIGKNILEEPMAELETLISPKIEFDWRILTFAFLPHQIKDLDKLAEVLERNPEYIGYVNIEQYKDFLGCMAKYQKFANIKNLGATVHAMVVRTLEAMDSAGYDENEQWTQLSSIIGTSAIPQECAETLKACAKKLVEEGKIDGKRKWEMLLYLAENYLGDGDGKTNKV